MQQLHFDSHPFVACSPAHCGFNLRALQVIHPDQLEELVTAVHLLQLHSSQLSDGQHKQKEWLG